jgi:hypothetical protein
MADDVNNNNKISSVKLIHVARIPFLSMLRTSTNLRLGFSFLLILPRHASDKIKCNEVMRGVEMLGYDLRGDTTGDESRAQGCYGEAYDAVGDQKRKAELPLQVPWEQVLSMLRTSTNLRLGFSFLLILPRHASDKIKCNEVMRGVEMLGYDLRDDTTGDESRAQGW